MIGAMPSIPPSPQVGGLLEVLELVSNAKKLKSKVAELKAYIDEATKMVELVGKVNDAGGKPLKGARITAAWDEDHSRTVTTGADGTYRLPCLAVGEVRLAVTHHGCERLRQIVHGRARVELTRNVVLVPTPEK